MSFSTVLCAFSLIQIIVVNSEFVSSQKLANRGLSEWVQTQLPEDVPKPVNYICRFEFTVARRISRFLFKTIDQLTNGKLSVLTTTVKEDYAIAYARVSTIYHSVIHHIFGVFHHIRAIFNWVPFFHHHPKSNAPTTTTTKRPMLTESTKTTTTFRPLTTSSTTITVPTEKNNQINQQTTPPPIVSTPPPPSTTAPSPPRDENPPCCNPNGGNQEHWSQPFPGNGPWIPIDAAGNPIPPPMD